MCVCIYSMEAYARIISETTRYCIRPMNTPRDFLVYPMKLCHDAESPTHRNVMRAFHIFSFPIYTFPGAE